MKDIQIRTRIIAIFLFLGLAFSAAGCGQNKTASLEDFFRGLLAACGENTVFLNSWDRDVTDKTTSDLDPIGGYLYLYWIDGNGLVCHGNPGEDGQPGPVILIAWTDESYRAIDDHSNISLDQLKDMQEIPINVGNYSGEGLHFAQYANWKWRSRELGYGFSDPGSFRYSIPEIVSLDQEFCLMPVMAVVYPECLHGSGFPLPDPSVLLEDQAGSDPGVCQNRIQPSSFNMQATERASYCLTK